MSASMGPAHDRVRLTTAEQRALAELAQCFADDESTRHGHERGRKAAMTAASWVWRRAAWLVPLGIVAMILVGAFSTTAGAVLGLLTSVLLLLAPMRAFTNRSDRSDWPPTEG
ncbi:hypothetical protein [Egicoccus sp. AB-alg2]|uniref:hypothetical protein n=1 Tax=Egicoccus sp. AB-alg2 TaxID=3242693 RepID=UPI00359DF5F0